MGAVAALAAPEADAYYGSLAATWPSAYGYGVQSTCYGCYGHYLGKRSADADAYYGYGVGLGLYNNNIHGLNYFGSGNGISQVDPSGRSFQHTSRLHKREADADADAYYSHGYGYGHGGYYSHGYGLSYGHGYGHGYGHRYGYGYLG